MQNLHDIFNVVDFFHIFIPLGSILTFRVPRFDVRDSSNKMHKKGILYHGLTICEVSTMGRATIVTFQFGRLMLHFPILKKISHPT